jgi:Cof subfamily protein (haloacid dehalogenase superfamily)
MKSTMDSSLTTSARGLLPFLIIVLLTLCPGMCCSSQSWSPPITSSNPAIAPQLVSKAFLANYDIKCILSDVDGTLLTSETNKHHVSKRTFTAIASIIDSGYPFYPCTGRSRCSMASAAPEMANLFGGDIKNIPGVYQQGLQVYGPNGNLIYEKFLGFEEIADVVQFCDLHNVAVIAYAGDRIYCRQRCRQTDKIGQYSEPPPDVYANGLENLGEIGVNVNKLILLDDEVELIRIRPLLFDYMQQSVSLTKAVPGMLEVLPYGSSKGEGVAVLLEHLGMSPKNVMAFGDGENDVEMFSLVELGIAVNNAKNVLKDVAKAVTSSNDDDGVAEVLELFLKSKTESPSG